jgi:hypothetical protein
MCIKYLFILFYILYMSNFNNIVNGNIIAIGPPTGSIIAYLGTTDPSGWVIADGTARSNTGGLYNALLTASIGTQTGSTYTPPNYNGAFLRGIGTSPSTTYAGPTTVGTSQTDMFGAHNHGITEPTDGHAHTLPLGETRQLAQGNYWSSYGTGFNVVSEYSKTGITINNSGGTETRPFNYGVNWIIKL